MDQLSQKLQAAFAPARLAAFLEIIVEGEALTEEERERLSIYVADKATGIRVLAEALCEDDDAEDLYQALVTAWLELRTEWMRYNLTLQFNMVRGTVAPPRMLLRAGCCSTLLREVEQLLRPADREELEAFAARLAMGEPLAA